MPYHHNTQTYEDIYKDLSSACDWLNSLRIPYSKTRFGNYKRLYQKAAHHQKNGTIAQFSSDPNFSYAEWVNASYEVHELNRIWLGLNGQTSDTFINRLKTAASGHHLFSMEKPDSSGRDISFELLNAARFTWAGFTPDFGHDADLSIKIDNRPLYAECKRLKSKNKVQVRIKEGLQQLKRRYRKGSPSTIQRGFLIVSISKLINSELGKLEAKTIQELSKNAAQIVDQFIADHNIKSVNLVDKKTLGILVTLECPGEVTSNNMLYNVSESALVTHKQPGSPDYTFLIELRDKVWGSPFW